MMRVLVIAPGQIAPVPPPAYGGSEAHVFDLLEGFKTMRIEADLVAPDGSQNPAGRVIETGPATKRFGPDTEVVEAAKGVLHGYDVVHSHLYFPQALYELKKATPFPMVHTMLGISSWQKAPEDPKPCIVTLGPWHRKETFGRLGINSREVPCAVNVDRYPLSEKQRSTPIRLTPGGRPISLRELTRDGYYLCFGLISPDKGQLEAIEVARARDVNLIVAGEDTFVPDPNYVAVVRHACKEAGFKYYGAVNPAMKLGLMAGARALLQPFKVPQTGSLLAIEAMLTGTEVYSTKHGGLAELPTQNWNDFINGTGEPRPPKTCRNLVKDMNDHVGVASQYVRLYKEAMAGGW